MMKELILKKKVEGIILEILYYKHLGYLIKAWNTYNTLHTPNTEIDTNRTKGAVGCAKNPQRCEFEGLEIVVER